MKILDNTRRFYEMDSIVCKDGNRIFTLFNMYIDKGKLIAKEDASQLIKHLTQYIECVSQEDIDEYNKLVDMNTEQEVKNLQLLQQNYKRPVHPKHVYLFYSDILNRYKIGISQDVKRRAKEFSYVNAVIVTNTSLREDAELQEALLHKPYEQFSCGNEWFSFDQKLAEDATELIKNL